MESSKGENDEPKENTPQVEEEELITDFSVMFKGKHQIKRPPKLSERQVQKPPNWLIEIPVKLTITKEQMCERKAFDQRRWKSMVKASIPEDRILSSVASTWNYLFSTKGTGNLQELTLTSAKKILEQINVQYHTEQQFKRKDVLLNCFSRICQHFGVQFQSRVSIKLAQPQKIEAVQGQDLKSFLSGLAASQASYIYLTYKNVLVPLGFDKTPLVQLDAFKKLSEIKEEKTELWIINSPTLRFKPSFLTKRWRDIKTNLETVWPNFTELQSSKKGVQRHADARQENEAQERGTSNCIIELRKKEMPQVSVE